MACSRIKTIAEGVCRSFNKEACVDSKCALQHIPAQTKYWDTHCHLDRLHLQNEISYKDIDFPPNFGGLITNFIDPNLFDMAPDILDQAENIFGTIGYHPQHAGKMNKGWKSQLISLLDHPKIIAVGETGLDAKHAEHTPISQQILVYRMQLEIARDYNKPLVLHCRDEHSKMLDIAKQIVEFDQKIHLHCFTGNKSQASAWVDSFPNLKIGVTNLVTNKKVIPLREAIEAMPLSRLLIETDAPYMFPRNLGKSYKHKFTHPGMSLNAAAEISKIKNISLIEVLNVTTENCKHVYFSQ